MPAKSGVTMLLKIKNDATPTPALVTIGGLRSKSVSFNSELVDITNSDSVNMWREVLGGVGVNSFSASGSGRTIDLTSTNVIYDALADRTLRDVELTIPNLGVITCTARITALEITGNYNDACDFTFTIESASNVTFVIATS